MAIVVGEAILKKAFPGCPRLDEENWRAYLSKLAEEMGGFLRLLEWRRGYGVKRPCNTSGPDGACACGRKA